MPSTALLAILALAYLSAPPAFILLWLAYRRTGEASLRLLTLSLLGLCLLMAGNTASYVLDNLVGLEDARVGFLILNEVFLSAVMTGAFLSLFAHECARTRASPGRKGLFWAFTILFFFLVISFPIFLSGPGSVNLHHGYIASSIYTTMCQAYATWILIRNRRKLPLPWFQSLPAFFAALLGIGLLSVANDFLHFGALLRGPDFPFSPFFFLIINASVVLQCAKALLAREEPEADTGGKVPDFGLTGREGEILPLLLEGLSNEDIAARLFISPHTVKNHVTIIFRKAGVANRFELLKRATNPAS
jgi:DNA-binding CsgD family transcriptional regulator